MEGLWKWDTKLISSGCELFVGDNKRKLSFGGVVHML